MNDAPEDAARLVERLRGIPAKVNLIPMNPHADSSARPPTAEAIEAFAEILLRRGLRATLRRPRGDDIDAACGQLHNRRQGRQGRHPEHPDVPPAGPR